MEIKKEFFYFALHSVCSNFLRKLRCGSDVKMKVF